MGGRKFRLDVHRKNEERKKKLKRLNSSGKDTERKKKQCKGTTKNVWRKKPEQSNPPEKEPDPPQKEPDQSNPRSNPPEKVENDITLPTITIPIAAFTRGIVQLLPQLSRRISRLLAKSCTWTVASIDPLVLCKLNVQSPNAGVATASVTSTITITSELHWTI